MIQIDNRIHEILDRYALTYFPAMPLNTIPVQRCSDNQYITDHQVLDYYRNLHYGLIQYQDYANKVIRGMVDYSFWLVTSMSSKGIKSPINMYHWKNIHPGKKRYIVANYLQLDTVPLLVQHWNDEVKHSGGIAITSLEQLIALYDNNVSINVRIKADELLIECSWHGETNRRDSNGYDDWYRAAAESVNERNSILDYIMREGLHIESDVKNCSINNGIFKTYMSRDKSSHDFYLRVPDTTDLRFELWNLYYHFDPRIGIKRCQRTGIEIVNQLGDPNWIIDNLDFSKTLTRPWLLDPEKYIA